MTTVDIPKSHYQSFEPGSGSSNSPEKLKALRLPKDLTGKRVLDLGCNHGFFCFAALDLGAAEVVGIDRDPESIKAAQARATLRPDGSKATFINKSWTNFFDETWKTFNEGRYDIVLLLSALHYAPDQEDFLEKVSRLLTPDGMLVLECGIINNPKRAWTSIIRGTPPKTDIVEYATSDEMFRILSKNYAPRHKGESVKQPGDNVPRYVFHCPKLKRMVMLINGPSSGGKSTLTRPFEYAGIPQVDIDVIVLQQKADGKGPLADAVRDSFAQGRIDKCYDRILSEKLEDRLAELVVEACFKGPSHIPAMVAGTILANDSFHLLLVTKLNESGFIPWHASRSYPAYEMIMGQAP